MKGMSQANDKDKADKFTSFITKDKIASSIQEYEMAM